MLWFSLWAGLGSAWAAPTRLAVTPVQTPSTPEQGIALQKALTTQLDALEPVRAALAGTDSTLEADGLVVCGVLTLGDDVRLDCRITGVEVPQIHAAVGVGGKANDPDGLACAVVAEMAPTWNVPAPPCGKPATPAPEVLTGCAGGTLSITVKGDEQALQGWLVATFDTIGGVEARGGPSADAACSLDCRRSKKGLVCAATTPLGSIEVESKELDADRCLAAQVMATTLGLAEPSCPR